jgi:group I intron endonuclease
MGVIYIITSRTSGKSYVGQTKHTAVYRWYQHVWEANNPKAKQSRKLNNAILKYGIYDFTVDDLWECEEEDLDFWEIIFIDLYETFINGYNLTKGGKENQIVSDSTRNKLSSLLSGKQKDMVKNRIREEDKFLPKYLKHYKDSRGTEGYKICDHPKLNGGSVWFTSSDEPMDFKLMQAMETLYNVDNDIYIHRPNRKRSTGIRKISGGYIVKICGAPSKSFTSTLLTMEEKLKLAQDHSNSILGRMQFND